MLAMRHTLAAAGSIHSCGHASSSTDAAEDTTSSGMVRSPLRLQQPPQYDDVASSSSSPTLAGPERSVSPRLKGKPCSRWVHSNQQQNTWQSLQEPLSGAGLFTPDPFHTATASAGWGSAAGAEDEGLPQSPTSRLLATAALHAAAAKHQQLEWEWQQQQQQYKKQLQHKQLRQQEHQEHLSFLEQRQQQQRASSAGIKRVRQPQNQHVGQHTQAQLHPQVQVRKQPSAPKLESLQVTAVLEQQLQVLQRQRQLQQRYLQKPAAQQYSLRARTPSPIRSSDVAVQVLQRSMTPPRQGSSARAAATGAAAAAWKPATPRGAWSVAGAGSTVAAAAHAAAPTARMAAAAARSKHSNSGGGAGSGHHTSKLHRSAMCSSAGGNSRQLPGAKGGSYAQQAQKDSGINSSSSRLTGHHGPAPTAAAGAHSTDEAAAGRAALASHAAARGAVAADILAGADAQEQGQAARASKLLQLKHCNQRLRHQCLHQQHQHQATRDDDADGRGQLARRSSSDVGLLDAGQQHAAPAAALGYKQQHHYGQGPSTTALQGTNEVSGAWPGDSSSSGSLSGAFAEAQAAATDHDNSLWAVEGAPEAPDSCESSCSNPYEETRARMTVPPAATAATQISGSRGHSDDADTASSISFYIAAHGPQQQQQQRQQQQAFDSEMDWPPRKHLRTALFTSPTPEHQHQHRQQRRHQASSNRSSSSSGRVNPADSWLDEDDTVAAAEHEMHLLLTNTGRDGPSSPAWERSSAATEGATAAQGMLPQLQMSDMLQLGEKVPHGQQHLHMQQQRQQPVALTAAHEPAEVERLTQAEEDFLLLLEGARHSASLPLQQQEQEPLQGKAFDNAQREEQQQQQEEEEVEEEEWHHTQQPQQQTMLPAVSPRKVLVQPPWKPPGVTPSISAPPPPIASERSSTSGGGKARRLSPQQQRQANKSMRSSPASEQAQPGDAAAGEPPSSSAAGSRDGSGRSHRLLLRSNSEPQSSAQVTDGAADEPDTQQCSRGWQHERAWLQEHERRQHQQQGQQDTSRLLQHLQVCCSTEDLGLQEWQQAARKLQQQQQCGGLTLSFHDKLQAYLDAQQSLQPEDKQQQQQRRQLHKQQAVHWPHGIPAGCPAAGTAAAATRQAALHQTGSEGCSSMGWVMGGAAGDSTVVNHTLQQPDSPRRQGQSYAYDQHKMGLQQQNAAGVAVPDVPDVGPLCSDISEHVPPQGIKCRLSLPESLQDVQDGDGDWAAAALEAAATAAAAAAAEEEEEAIELLGDLAAGTDMADNEAEAVGEAFAALLATADDVGELQLLTAAVPGHPGSTGSQQSSRGAPTAASRSSNSSSKQFQVLLTDLEQEQHEVDLALQQGLLPDWCSRPSMAPSSSASSREHAITSSMRGSRQAWDTERYSAGRLARFSSDAQAAQVADAASCWPQQQQREQQQREQEAWQDSSQPCGAADPSSGKLHGEPASRAVGPLSREVAASLRAERASQVWMEPPADPYAPGSTADHAAEVPAAAATTATDVASAAPVGCISDRVDNGSRAADWLVDRAAARAEAAAAAFARKQLLKRAFTAWWHGFMPAVQTQQLLSDAAAASADAFAAARQQRLLSHCWSGWTAAVVVGSSARAAACQLLQRVTQRQLLAEWRQYAVQARAMRREVVREWRQAAQREQTERLQEDIAALHHQRVLLQKAWRAWVVAWCKAASASVFASQLAAKHKATVLAALADNVVKQQRKRSAAMRAETFRRARLLLLCIRWWRAWAKYSRVLTAAGAAVQAAARARVIMQVTQAWHGYAQYRSWKRGAVEAATGFYWSRLASSVFCSWHDAAASSGRAKAAAAAFADGHQQQLLGAVLGEWRHAAAVSSRLEHALQVKRHRLLAVCLHDWWLECVGNKRAFELQVQGLVRLVTAAFKAWRRLAVQRQQQQQQHSAQLLSDVVGAWQEQSSHSVLLQRRLAAWQAAHPARAASHLGRWQQQGQQEQQELLRQALLGWCGVAGLHKLWRAEAPLLAAAYYQEQLIRKGWSGWRQQQEQQRQPSSTAMQQKPAGVLQKQLEVQQLEQQLRELEHELQQGQEQQQSTDGSRVDDGTAAAAAGGSGKPAGSIMVVADMEGSSSKSSAAAAAATAASSSPDHQQQQQQLLQLLAEPSLHMGVSRAAGGSEVGPREGQHHGHSLVGRSSAEAAPAASCSSSTAATPPAARGASGADVDAWCNWQQRQREQQMELEQLTAAQHHWAVSLCRRAFRCWYQEAAAGATLMSQQAQLKHAVQQELCKEVQQQQLLKVHLREKWLEQPFKGWLHMVLLKQSAALGFRTYQLLFRGFMGWREGVVQQQQQLQRRLQTGQQGAPNALLQDHQPQLQQVCLLPEETVQQAAPEDQPQVLHVAQQQQQEAAMLRQQHQQKHFCHAQRRQPGQVQQQPIQQQPGQQQQWQAQHGNLDDMQQCQPLLLEDSEQHRGLLELTHSEAAFAEQHGSSLHQQAASAALGPQSEAAVMVPAAAATASIVLLPGASASIPVSTGCAITRAAAAAAANVTRPRAALSTEGTEDRLLEPPTSLCGGAVGPAGAQGGTASLQMQQQQNRQHLPAMSSLGDFGCLQDLQSALEGVAHV